MTCGSSDPEIYVHMYGFLKYYVFYLYLLYVECMCVCQVSSIYVDMYGFMLLNYYVFFHVFFHVCFMFLHVRNMTTDT